MQMLGLAVNQAELLNFFGEVLVAGGLYMGYHDLKERIVIEMDNFFKEIGFTKDDKAPKLVHKSKENGLYTLVYEIPTGKSLGDLQAKQEALEDHLGCRVELSKNKGEVTIKCVDFPKFTYYLLCSAVKQIKNKRLAMPLGLSSKGYLIHDFEEEPHILFGGPTKSGKTVAIRQGLATMCYRYKSEYLNIWIVDLKRGVDTKVLTKAPHTKDIIIERNKVLEFLNDMIQEMNNRLDLLTKYNIDNITQYKGDMPYIIIYFDEMADFATDTRGEVKKLNENIRHKLEVLASKSRAVGIHLILSTQRPTVSVIDGNIKNNFWARVAFPMVSQYDSKTILDNDKAKDLVMRKGRAIYQVNSPVEFQFPYLDKQGTEDIMQKITTDHITEDITEKNVANKDVKRHKDVTNTRNVKRKLSGGGELL